MAIVTKGKNQYIDESIKILKKQGYTDLKCKSKNKTQSRCCFQVNPAIYIQVEYKRDGFMGTNFLSIHIEYDIATPSSPKKKRNDFDKITSNYRNVYYESAMKSHADDNTFTKYLEGIFKKELYPQIDELIEKHIDLVKERIKNGEMVGDLKIENSFDYLKSMNLTDDEMKYLFEITNDEKFVPQEAIDIFLF